MKKLIAVINSMNSILQIDATRKYIDLYYKKFGESKKDFIEYYFRNKLRFLKISRKGGKYMDNKFWYVAGVALLAVALAARVEPLRSLVFGPAA